MKYFFFLSQGRTGTKFIADLLSKAPGTLIYHEPAKVDRVYFGLRYTGKYDIVLDSILENRFKELIPKENNTKIYGEVNSYLRYEVDWLKQKFNPIMFHLVRDGRDFVRSVYTREVYTPNENKLITVPRDDDPYASKWDKMNRFQKLCWYWMHTNEYLYLKIERRVIFEKLLTDYQYFNDSVLKPVELDIPFRTWQREVKRPKNTSKKKAVKKKIKRGLMFWEKKEIIEPIPHWTQWNNEQIQQFDEICAETMEKLGYYTNQ